MATAIPLTPSIEENDGFPASKLTKHDSSEIKHTAPVTPPLTDESNKGRGSNASDLSDLDLDDEDEEEIEPDHYYDDGKIPVFKPTMDQFRSFKSFVEKIDKYGMKSGIVKVIPPKEWLDSLPPLDEQVKSIRIKNPITQEFGGAHGTYTQANIEKQRSYNLPQWKSLTEESQHQPPARRGERRKNQEKVVRGQASKSEAASPDGPGAEGRRGRGRPRKSGLSAVTVPEEDQSKASAEPQAPPTPTSPNMEPEEKKPKKRGRPFGSTKAKKEEDAKTVKSSPGPKGSQAKSVAERRKYNTAGNAPQIDEAAFRNFDYRFEHNDEFTKERCAELEYQYWRSLNFAPPMYGGDMPGSLFDETTTSWNVAKLENLLDVLGQKVPGVNTTYLYLGMWKATFAWHLEDVDLYSINYVHFGAPKQWYSISQEDARRFENAMKTIWTSDAKNCSQFLRHKTYLISPDLLQKQFNIKVNKLVHYEGEFVITFPYGYHSGYNLGYNCAESVNFATESWLEFGRIAKKCDCEADSVWVDVGEIERKLRGEPTPEYYEETDDEDDMDDGADHLPTPPASTRGRPKGSTNKRKRNDLAQGKKKVKKIKIRIRTSSFQPCVLCPNHTPSEPLLRTDTGKQAHRLCALYTPETSITERDGEAIICGIANVDKARFELKCNFCRSKTGTCFQCSSRKCTRAYHATCAAAAGVLADFGPIAVYGEDGTEYASSGYDFRCKFHRPKRPKVKEPIERLEDDSYLESFAKSVEVGTTLQFQYLDGDVFAGTVVANRHSEKTLVVDVLPDGDTVEVDWRYLLALNPDATQRPRPSPDALPLPEHMSKQILENRNAEFGPPQDGDVFCDSSSGNKWAEFHTAPAPHNKAQVKIDFDKPDCLWYYLGKTSTDARSQFTEDPKKPQNNPASNFLETVRPVVTMPTTGQQQQHHQQQHQQQKPVKRPSSTSFHPSAFNYHALNAVSRQIPQQQQHNGFSRTYGYKPKSEGGQMSVYQTPPRDQADIVRPSCSPITPYNGQNIRPHSGSFTGSVCSGMPQMHTATPYETSIPRRTSSQWSGPPSLSQETPNLVSAPLHKHTPSAPMANMHAKHHALPRTSPTVSHAPALNATAQPNRPHADPAHLARLKKYPYLSRAFLRRDEFYTSPYIGDESLSEPYAIFLTQQVPSNAGFQSTGTGPTKEVGYDAGGDLGDAAANVAREQQAWPRDDAAQGQLQLEQPRAPQAQMGMRVGVAPMASMGHMGGGAAVPASVLDPALEDSV